MAFRRFCWPFSTKQIASWGCLLSIVGGSETTRAADIQAPTAQTRRLQSRKATAPVRNPVALGQSIDESEADDSSAIRGTAPKSRITRTLGTATPSCDADGNQVEPVGGFRCPKCRNHFRGRHVCPCPSPGVAPGAVLTPGVAPAQPGTGMPAVEPGTVTPPVEPGTTPPPSDFATPPAPGTDNAATDTNIPPPIDLNNGGQNNNGQDSTLGSVASAQSAAPYLIGDLLGPQLTGASVLPNLVAGPTISVPTVIQPAGQAVPIISGGHVTFNTVDAPFASSNIIIPGTTFTSNHTVNQINQSSSWINQQAFAIDSGSTSRQNAIAAGNHLLYGTGVTHFNGGVASLSSGNSSNAGDPNNLYNASSVQSFTPVTVTGTYSNLIVPSPSGVGGTLGTVKIVENTSPMPRDRVFFNYSNFTGVPLTTGGINLNRFSPGFEKTFFNGQSSLEVRMPFASTLDNEITSNGVQNTNSIQFGNMSFALKSVAYRSPQYLVSGGLQFTIPTADNINVRQVDGLAQAEVKNQSYHLMPFIGSLYTPNDRFFAQNFIQLDFDANGHDVLVNSNGNGLRSVGHIQDSSYLYVDTGVGYWVYRNPYSMQMLTGIAPTFEMHYNQSLQSNDFIRGGNYTVGSNTGNVNTLNAVLGGTFQFGSSSTLTVGYVTPVGNRADKQFNNEVRIFYNYRFGRQNRQTRATF